MDGMSTAGSKWSNRCDRCRAEVTATIMSRFNTQVICFECEVTEQKHPQYEAACKAEEAACRRGEYNFRGIGKPSDL